MLSDAPLGQLPGHVSSLARFLARRETRERDDRSTLADLARARIPLPPELELEWLGTAGYRLTFEGHTLLIDPYLSRVPLTAVLNRRAPAHADPAAHAPLLSRSLGKTVGILLGHTHFDHAIDVPALSKTLDAPAYGSDSLVRLMGLYGLADRAVEVSPHRTYELGPFRVRFIPSLHSKLLLGFKVPMDGALSCEHLDELSPSAYKCGAVYGIHIQVGGTSFYHQGSANLIDDQLQDTKADIFLAGIAGRGFTYDYWQRILRRLEPAVVVASHFDDFFRPLGAPLGFTTNVNLAAFPEELSAVSESIVPAALEPGVVPRAQSPGNA
ncbi:MAG: MBL fold metallo-hydrolase [Solirubrobacterales bacterium]|nr:MBL fold metallo-hydrolase [Solirubrobacterales bacterium]